MSFFNFGGDQLEVGVIRPKTLVILKFEEVHGTQLDLVIIGRNQEETNMF